MYWGPPDCSIPRLLRQLHCRLCMLRRLCCPALQEAGLALQLLEEAALRLRESASFDRGAVAPHNALGDVLLAHAEGLAAGSNAAAAAAAASAALQEGYHEALRINASCPEALVGVAEANVQLARLAGACAAAAVHWRQAADAYRAALGRPEALGSWGDRSDVRYNFACCLVHCGREEEARGLLAQLVAAGAVSTADVQQDADLAPLRTAFS